jgi:sugar lactone lactonase YvrE
VNGNTLQTLCLDGDGNVVALVAPGRYGAKPASPVSEVQVYTPAGEPLRQWKVNFLAQSINSGPDGAVFVAGDGRIAKFDKNGKAVTEIELPQVAALLKDADKLRKQAKEQLEQEVQSYEQMAKQFKDQQDRLKKKDSDETITQNEKAQLRALDQNVKIYEQIAAQTKKKSVDQVVTAMTSGLRTINALAVTEKDVFVVCGATKGHGYAVWRMSQDFTDAKEIIPSVIGCCGQMDVQARGDELFVAENCSHAVGKYTRDGKKLASFGKKGQNLEPECFGGCCNPMNVRVTTDGSVYTAESEGHIKLFNPKGEFVGCVGTASLKGGCKNVALAVSPDGEKVYFCDQPGSRILVLAKKAAKAAE